ncbi:hypothetical protein BUALT_Bualt06G0034600 [Buddleja alternifolia]|uniref:Myb-like domain-containing protein n=1 Tax=Buddleja alternifolia TaxID=168488 RepID=A0AAV6XN71_9LAMI|nr:hypothetical protein BUALT_Bualt06G0034600 [Buddleja alternifolia]
MGIDLDPLDDIFADEAVKNARPVGKFQPKAKFRPSKKDLAATSVSSTQAVQTIDTAKSELSEPVRTTKPSEHSSDVVPNDNGGGHASIEKSGGENAEIFIGSEALDDCLPHPTTDMGTVRPSEATSLNASSNPENAEGGLASPEQSADLDPLTAGDPIISISDGYGHLDNRGLGGEEMDVIDSIGISELTAKSGQRTGKFKPKPKIQLQEDICEGRESVSYSLGSQSVPPKNKFTEKDSIHIQHNEVLDISDLGLTHSLPTKETSELPLNEESANLMEMTQLDSGIHLESVPEIPAKLWEGRGCDGWVGSGAGLGQGVRLGSGWPLTMDTEACRSSRRAKAGPSVSHTASDPSIHQQKASASSHENETGRSLRPRKGKANLCELVDEPEDEVLASGDSYEEYPTGSALEDENSNNEEFQVESESKTKKVKRKSKKADDDKEKPAKKQKKAKEASDQDADAKLKKFSHSTRRRRVDKVLLETPEDEIDYQKVPLRDLILLAEHKERQTKKEEAAAGAPATTQSKVNRSDPYNQDENLASEQDREYNDGETPMVEDSTIYFNYQTYMDKTPIARWSKQDTEVFYEAIRQFGTDLSMIQQLFPGRTRRQVKLKYKKEERQHPLRLREALTNRTKDHSHFQTVIERLQKMAAEEKQNAEKDSDLTGNEEDEEGTSHADDDEESKDERVEEVENEDVANDTVEVGSPSKSDEVEDDLFIWSHYKSDA